MWRDEIRKALPRARFDEPLRRHTTFRIGGPADCYAEPHDVRELRLVLRVARDLRVPFFLLGYGSNLLVRDKGVRGLVVRLRGEFERVQFLEGSRVRAGAGARIPRLVSLCAGRGLAGAEPLVGVPGTVGGALVMNAGTRDGVIGPLVVSASVLAYPTLEEESMAAADLRFDYRRSSLEGRIVLGCLLQLKAGGQVDIMDRVKRYQRRRLETQPVHTHNVGSIFKNPPGRFVAKLIEDAGLKGASVGGARVSPKHANFIENQGGAAAADVLELVDRIRGAVRRREGLELELEMKVVGEA